MAYKGTRSPCSKLHYAATTAAILAYLALRQSDRVGLIAYDEELQLNIPPSGKSNQLQRLAANMQRLSSRGTADHERALTYAAQNAGGKSMVVLLSDLLEAEDAVKPMLKRLSAAQNDCMLMHVLDPDELDLPFRRTTRFYDSESGASVVTSPEQVREFYSGQMQSFLEQVQQGCREAHVDYLKTETSQDVANILAAYLHHRRPVY